MYVTWILDFTTFTTELLSQNHSQNSVTLALYTSLVCALKFFVKLEEVVLTILSQPAQYELCVHWYDLAVAYTCTCHLLWLVFQISSNFLKCE